MYILYRILLWNPSVLVCKNLNTIFRAMSGPVKPVFASPTGLMPEHTVNMAGSCSLIDNLVTRCSSDQR